MIEPKVLANELADAYANRREIAVLPTSREPALDLATAYRVEAELVRWRSAQGQRTVGRKVGFANKAMWRALKLETLLWAHMYDDTVHYATDNACTLSVARMHAPKIEPEIVFKLRHPLHAGGEPAAVLDAVEWIALGFEIIDCMYADWKFQPADFVASYGLHTGLIVGEPLRIEPGSIAGLVDRLPSFTVTLKKDGAVVAEGSGKNSLRSPALALGELASALAKQPGASPLGAGELVSSGTLTESHPIAPAQTWSAEVSGIELPGLTLRVTQD